MSPNHPDLAITSRDLPHWRLDGATYFVTFRLELGQPAMTAAERTVVVASLHHFVGSRYSLAAWVVMDDHAHAIVRPFAISSLSATTHGWKSFTAHVFTRDFGRAAPVWQRESLDRIIRDQTEFARFRDYILKNPQKRWPGTGSYEWVGCALES